MSQLQNSSNDLSRIDNSIKSRLARLEKDNEQVKEFMSRAVPPDLSRLLNDARTGKDSSITTTQ